MSPTPPSGPAATGQSAAPAGVLPPPRSLHIPPVPPGPPGSGTSHRGTAPALLVMGVLLAILLVAVIVDRAPLSDTDFHPVPPRIVAWALAAGLFLLLVGLGIHTVARPGKTRLVASWAPLLVATTLLTGWGLAWFLNRISGREDARIPLLLCVGTTAFAVLAFRRLQRNWRLPWWILLLGLGWGVTAALPAPLLLGTTVRVVVEEALAPGITRVILTVGLPTAVIEEVSKGIGVLLAYLLLRRQVSTILSGIVLGAIVGLGFNLTESVMFMLGDTGRMLFQFWHRQAFGMPFGHATLTAIVGAGIGLAAHQRRWLARVACITSGFMLAIAAHALWNVAVIQGLRWESDNPTADLLLWTPLTLFVYKGPLFVLVMVMAILGLRMETKALVAELRAEATTRLDAVRPEEVPLLARPHLRFLARVQALCDHGLRARRLVAALHRAQIRLALARWHRARSAGPEPPGAEAALRLHIGALRRQLFALGMSRIR